MLIEPTIDKLHAMKLSGMATALQEQRRNANISELRFEDRLAMLVERQYLEREDRALKTRLKYAGLRDPGPTIEAINYRLARKLSRSQVEVLHGPDWVRHGRNVLLTGATGLGKSFIAEALARQACRNGFRAMVFYAPKFFRLVKTAELDGSLPRLLRKLGRANLLMIDDLGMETAKPADYRILLEILHDRIGTSSTLVTSQFDTDTWHPIIRDATVADAILDRLVHGAYRIRLEGESVRKQLGGKDDSAGNGS